jgi:hypothetical protein
MRILGKERKIVKISKDFDREVIQFLEEGWRYLKYDLEITIKARRSISPILELIDGTANKQNISFRSITIEILDMKDVKESLNALYDGFVERNIDPSCIKTEFYGTFYQHDYDWRLIKYVNQISLHPKFEFPQRIHELTLNIGLHSTRKRLKTISPVTKLVFDFANLFIHESELVINKVLYESIKEIKFWFYSEYSVFIKEEKSNIYSNLIEKWMNLEKIEYNLKNVWTQTKNLFLDLIQNNVSITTAQPENGYIVQENATVYYPFEGKLRSFKCSKLVTEICSFCCFGSNFMVIPINDNMNFHSISCCSSTPDKTAEEFFNGITIPAHKKWAFYI